MGVGKGAGGTWFLKFLEKMVVFFVSSGKKQIPPLFAPLQIFWKNPLVSPWKKNFRGPCGRWYCSINIKEIIMYHYFQ